MYRLTKITPLNRPKPLTSYTTTFLWCGFQCLNLHEKTCRTISPTEQDGIVKIEQVPFPNVLSRIDYSEEVTVKTYPNGAFSENEDLFTPI